MWFEKSNDIKTVEDGLLYPLRQTAQRRNVQIQLSKLETLSKLHPEFFVVIYDEANRAYYISYSWLKSKVLPRARIRHRPNNPKERYLTVDELRGKKHFFSFGLDKEKTPLHLDLSWILQDD